MPTPRLITINAWSYSRFSTYNQCPYKAKLTILEKRREPQNAAMEKGTLIHAMADVYTSGALPDATSENAGIMPALKKVLEGKKIPPELECFKKEFAVMQKAGAQTEAEWAFDREWNYLPPPNGWFSPQAWLRVKVDSHYLTQKKLKGGLTETTCHIVDHKTGKINAKHRLQRSLYGLGAFLVYPDVAEVQASHWYLDAGIEHKDSWRASQLNALKKEWLQRIEAMMNDTTFAPNPTTACKWCHFRKANSGPCIY